jgi:hypothetical protein
MNTLDCFCFCFLPIFSYTSPTFISILSVVLFSCLFCYIFLCLSLFILFSYFFQFILFTSSFSFSFSAINTFLSYNFKSHDSSVGIALGYGLDDRGSRVRFPAWAGNFSLHHRVQNGSGAHPASYAMGTRGSFLGGKAAGAWSWPLTFI